MVREKVYRNGGELAKPRGDREAPGELPQRPTESPAKGANTLDLTSNWEERRFCCSGSRNKCVHPRGACFAGEPAARDQSTDASGSTPLPFPNCVHYVSEPFGSNLRYWVRNRQRELACLLWTSPAWKMKPRDLWIGWSDEQRQRHLPWIVNNGRFLILPWVHVKGLASKILAHAVRQLPADWESHYGHPPLLLETLVDASRFRGTCYRAANWIYVGQTTGRGRMDREHKAHGKVIKDIYLYPLVFDAKQRLCSGPTR